MPEIDITKGLKTFIKKIKNSNKLRHTLVTN